MKSSETMPGVVNPDLMNAARRCVELARRKGADEAEAYVENGRNLDVTARDGAVETVKQSESMGLGLRVFAGRKLGFGSTSDLRAERLEAFVDRVLALAKVTAEDEYNRLPAADDLRGGYATQDTFDPEVAKLPMDWFVARSIEVEKIAMDYDRRIKTMNSAGAGRYIASWGIVGSSGAEASAASTYVWIVASPYAEDEHGAGQTGWAYDTRCHLAEMMSAEAIGREAGKRTVDMLGAQKIPSGSMPVVFHPEMTKGFMQGLIGALNGDLVFKKSSFLHDRLGQGIASPLVTIAEEPNRPRGTSSTPFDGEGVPTRDKVLVDQGTLTTFLYDTYTASKAGAKSTGNATRSYGSLPSIGTFNLRWAPGATKSADLFAGIDRGLFVTRMMGRGVNVVTGDYSRGAQGFLIEKGEITTPVQEITVAAHMEDMMRAIDAVGDDLDTRGGTWAPSIRFGELTVSGK